MKVNEFFKQNSLHDSQIVNANYDMTAKKITLFIEQSPNEVNIPRSYNNCDNMVVEVKIEIDRIEFISMDIAQLSGCEIYGIKVGRLENYEIIMMQLFNDNEIYLEVYLRGDGINIEMKTI